jgi:hypothetical protein
MFHPHFAFTHFTYKILLFRLPPISPTPICLLPISPTTHFAYSPFCLFTISPIHHFTYCLILCLHLLFLVIVNFFQDFQSAFNGIVQIANLCIYMMENFLWQNIQSSNVRTNYSFKIPPNWKSSQVLTAVGPHVHVCHS